MWTDKVIYWSWSGEKNPTSTPTNKILLRTPKIIFSCSLAVGVVEPKKYTKCNRNDFSLEYRPVRSAIFLPLLDLYGFCYSRFISEKKEKDVK